MAAKEITLRVTIDLFSGRPNPVIDFSGKRAEELLERLKPSTPIARELLGTPPIPTLGYRGMVIEQPGGPMKGLPGSFRLLGGVAVTPAGGQHIADPELEEFICGSAPKGVAVERLREEIQRYRELEAFWNRFPWDKRAPEPVYPCPCSPSYEPAWWNVAARQPYNNCYNYATNYRTDTFAQPGKAAGAQYGALNCTEVRQGAIADALLDSPQADNVCPEVGHLVALVIAPNWDFHWYRKGRDGLWSHKPGATPVTNVDNSGQVIHDPRTADRGPYTDFCTFMLVKHGHIKIA